MPNLAKELKRTARSNRNDLNEQSAITEVSRLIAEKGAEDISILREMGMHRSVEFAQDLHGRKIELENLDKKYGQIFSEEEIKRIACKYALKFLPSDKYSGPVEPVMLEKIKAFFAESGLEMNKALLGRRMYVLAPPKAFELQERPRPVPPDPILFYKIEGGTNYRMIHKWGADLTPWRRILGWKYSSSFGYFQYWLLVLFLTGVLPLWVAYDKYLYQFGSRANESRGWMMIFPIAAAIIAIVIAICRITDDDYGGAFGTWENEWRTDIKPKI